MHKWTGFSADSNDLVPCKMGVCVEWPAQSPGYDVKFSEWLTFAAKMACHI